jgi:hypothetical protein
MPRSPPRAARGPAPPSSRCSSPAPSPHPPPRPPPRHRPAQVGLFDAFARLDGPALADWTLAFAGEAQACPDPGAFRAALCAQFDALRAAGTFEPGSPASGADALAAVLDAVRRNGVSLPGHVCAAVMTTYVLEGWSHRLDPKNSTLAEVRRIVAMKRGESKVKAAASYVAAALGDEHVRAELEILEHVPPLAPGTLAM